MFEFFEEANFSESRAGDSFVIVVQPDSFQSDDLGALFVLGFEHRAVGALANLFQLLVLLHLGGDVGGPGCDSGVAVGSVVVVAAVEMSKQKNQ